MEFTKKDLNKTLWVKPGDMEKNRKWYKLDATGKILWRLAVDVARLLLGKHKAYYADFRDAGDNVLVENIDKIKVTGNKLEAKIYHTYSGFKGNVRDITLGTLLQKDPAKVLQLVVRGMLAKNKLRDKRLKRLKIVTWTDTKYDHFKPINLYK